MINFQCHCLSFEHGLSVQGSACRTYLAVPVKSAPPFCQNRKAEIFPALLQAGLAEYNNLQGVSWRGKSIDDVTMKALLARESIGANWSDWGEIRLSGISWSTGNRQRACRPHVVHRHRAQSTGCQAIRTSSQGHLTPALPAHRATQQKIVKMLATQRRQHDPLSQNTSTSRISKAADITRSN